MTKSIKTIIKQKIEKKKPNKQNKRKQNKENKFSLMVVLNVQQAIVHSVIFDRFLSGQ